MSDKDVLFMDVLQKPGWSMCGIREVRQKDDNVPFFIFTLGRSLTELFEWRVSSDYKNNNAVILRTFDENKKVINVDLKELDVIAHFQKMINCSKSSWGKFGFNDEGETYELNPDLGDTLLITLKWKIHKGWSLKESELKYLKHMNELYNKERERLFDICFAMHSLNLPIYVMLDLLDKACDNEILAMVSDKTKVEWIDKIMKSCEKRR